MGVGGDCGLDKDNDKVNRRGGEQNWMCIRMGQREVSGKEDVNPYPRTFHSNSPKRCLHEDRWRWRSLSQTILLLEVISGIKLPSSSTSQLKKSPEKQSNLLKVTQHDSGGTRLLLLFTASPRLP